MKAKGKCPMSVVERVALVLCLSFVGVNLSYAQLAGFYPITSDGVSLSNGDFTLLIDTANSLLRQPRLAKGDSASWHSEQTGSHGTISVTDTFRHGSMRCHTLTYETNPMATSSANTVKLNWCDTPQGWKILS
jgi:hypothetical protein